MFVTRRTLVALLVLAAACASKSTTSQTTPSASKSATTRVSRNPDVLTKEELQDPIVAGSDAMTTIRQLRPAMFRNRGPQSFSNANAGTVQVSQDYGPLQPLNQLSSIDTRSLVEIRYLNANDAQSRFGINANGGPVIVVLTSTQPR